MKPTPLSDDEVKKLWAFAWTGDREAFARAIEAARDAKWQEALKQEPVAYGMGDTMLGRGHRLMMVRLDKGQDGCTIPLYAAPQPAQQESKKFEWTVFNSGGAAVIEHITKQSALEYLTEERIAKGWNAVGCEVIDTVEKLKEALHEQK